MGYSATIEVYPTIAWLIYDPRTTKQSTTFGTFLVPDFHNHFYFDAGTVGTRALFQA